MASHSPTGKEAGWYILQGDYPDYVARFGMVTGY
jgi:hypothetical protein